MIEMGGEVITPVTHLRAEDIRDLSAAQLAEKLAFCEAQQLTQMSDDRDGLWEAIQQSGAFFGRLWSQIGEGMDAPLRCFDLK